MEEWFFRPPTPEDIPAILALLGRCVDAVGDDWYTPQQRASWKTLFTSQALTELVNVPSSAPVPPGAPVIPVVPDVPAVQTGAASPYSLVALHHGGDVRAFASLVGDELKMLYVDPAAQGQGLGARLLQAMEAEACRWGLEALRVRASANARGFYEGRGYVQDQRPRWLGAASCDCGGQVMCTWMVKALTGGSQEAPEAAKAVNKAD